MTTNVLAPPPSALGRFQALHLGPYLFSLGFAVVAYLVIGPAQFVNALTIGAIYALVAIGYTMVYGIIELINFAHGDVFMVGAFCSMFVLTRSWARTDRSTTRSPWRWSCSSTSP